MAMHTMRSPYWVANVFFDAIASSSTYPCQSVGE